MEKLVDSDFGEGSRCGGCGVELEIGMDLGETGLRFFPHTVHQGDDVLRNTVINLARGLVGVDPLVQIEIRNGLAIIFLRLGTH